MGEVCVCVCVCERELRKELIGEVYGIWCACVFVHACLLARARARVCVCERERALYRTDRRSVCVLLK